MFQFVEKEPPFYGIRKCFDVVEEGVLVGRIEAARYADKVYFLPEVGTCFDASDLENISKFINELSLVLWGK